MLTFLMKSRYIGTHGEEFSKKNDPKQPGRHSFTRFMEFLDSPFICNMGPNITSVSRNKGPNIA